MIIIKDKERNTQMMIPRSSNLTGIENTADYVTEAEITKRGYATVSYVNSVVGQINKLLEEIIN